MRQIVIDTETTGLEPAKGHRIIEIGCIELNNRRVTGNNFHQYINPNREVDEDALAIHGITNKSLSDKPTFIEIMEEFLAFINGAEIIAHNASFDVGFLNHEIKLTGKNKGSIADYATVIDTLAIARKKFPGERNTLDAICKRYKIDLSGRTLHGALLDAELLTEAYLLMTGGGQSSLFSDNFDDEIEPLSSFEPAMESNDGTSRPKNPVIYASDQELAAHASLLEMIKKRSGKL